MIDLLSPAPSLINGIKEPDPKTTICRNAFSFILKTYRSKKS